MIHKMIAFTLVILMGSIVMADDTPRSLFYFTGADAAKEWQNVNDGVMGGVSERKFKIADKRTLEFFGNLLLENSGDFAFVRTKAKKMSLEKGDTLVAKVRGRWPGIYLEPLPQQAADRILLSGHGANQEGRMDRSQNSPGEVRGDFVW